MSVCLGQVVALNYATTQLEATRALVKLATNLLLTTEHAMVSGIFSMCITLYDQNDILHVINNIHTVRFNLFSCLDINECVLGTSVCNQLCNNTVGSYMCSCKTGFKLSADNQTCNGTNICYVTYNAM